MKKCLVVGIVLLFIGTAVIPSSGQQIEKLSFLMSGSIAGEPCRNFNEAMKSSSLSNWLSHRPIHISGDNDLTEKNGVTRGNGTKENPYVISGWKIDMRFQHPWYDRIRTKYRIIAFVLSFFIHNTTFGIFIINTNKYITIRDNYLLNWTVSDFPDGTAIYLANMRNITIENNLIDKCNRAVDFLDANQGIIIRNNTIRHVNSYTIIGEGAVIENNSLENCDMIKCSNSVIRYNLLQSCGIGIATWGPCNISHNNLIQCGVGIGCYWPPHACTILDNIIQGNSFAGIYAIEGCQPVIHNNNIFENAFGVNYLGGPMVNATLNWWGSDTGPSGAGHGYGDAVSEDVEYTPWLTSPNPNAGR